MTDNMQIIDAHQHFWKYNPVRDAWITDEMAAIRKDFMPLDLQQVLRQKGIDGCVAVQADQSEEETDFLLSLAEQHHFIKGIVGWIDLKNKNAEERLEHYSHQKKLKGFRHVLQAEGQRNFMLGEDFLQGLSLLHKFNFSYDILICPDQLPFIPRMVERFPGQRFVLDHLAKPPIERGEVEEWRKGIKALAKCGNVWCKVSGMVTEADWRNWEKKDFSPYLDVVVEAFGMDRLMFGSDWPVCLVAASYNKMFSIVENYFSQVTAREQEQFFGGNAISFYQLNETNGTIATG
jgi:L-fuconolactonase